MHPTTGNRAADANLSPAHSDGTGDGATSVLTAAKSALEQVPPRVLLVGNEEEDFYLIREILESHPQPARGRPRPCRPARRSRANVAAKPYGLGFVRARNRER